MGGPLVNYGTAALHRSWQSMKYGRLIGKAEAIVATGMPGLYRVIAFFGIQRIYSLGELGKAASAFSVAQILGFFTAIGWASLILVRVPAARTREDAVQRFYGLLGMGGVSALAIGAGVLLWALLFDPRGSWRETLAILIGWSIYQLARHYFLAHRKYRIVIAYDVTLLVVTACFVVTLHRLGVSAGWSLGGALAAIGGLMLISIGSPGRLAGDWKFEPKGIEFGFTNFLSGGIALSLVPIANAANGARFAGIISLIASFSLISALIPRAISMYRLPELSRLASDGQPLAGLTAQTAHEVRLACGVSFLVNCGIVLAIVLYKGAAVDGFWYTLICGMAICAQGCTSMLGMAYSSVLMVREESRQSMSINLASCGAFTAALGVFYLFTGKLNFPFTLAICLAITLLRNVMLKLKCAPLLDPVALVRR